MTTAELKEVLYDLTDENTNVKDYIRLNKGKFIDDNYNMESDTQVREEENDYKILISPYKKQLKESSVILDGLKNVVGRIENIGDYEVDFEIRVFLKEK